MFDRPASGERAVLVQLGIGAPVESDALEEFRSLAHAAGVQIVAVVTGRRDRPDPRFFAGSGKAAEVAAIARAEQAEVVLFNHALSAGQERNLEKLIGLRVLDRNALILDIFAQRARSHDGKLEVELAQLRHLASRLVRGWTHLERQKGGIGLRGPGETQLETDRRLLARRVRVLGERLERIKRQRDTGRAQRARIPVPSVALVGYTNAGKSTLFRALSGADTYVADQLFATLDPLVRRIRLPGGTEVVIADTVGFVRDLPHELVAAFRSTLTEAREASLLLHVVDASDPHRDVRIAQVNLVLEEIGAGAIEQLLVYNKIDRLGREPFVESRGLDSSPAVWLSAATGQGIDLLREQIAERLGAGVRHVRLRLAASHGALHARLYRQGSVMAERLDDDGGWQLDVALPRAELLSLQDTPGVTLEALLDQAQSCAPHDGFLQSRTASVAS
ncbi:MAG: ribosome rescue GTPase HflX [Steroidobacteraceae bacterium]